MAKVKRIGSNVSTAMLARHTPSTQICTCGANLVIRMGSIKECRTNGPTCSGKPPGTLLSNLQVRGEKGYVSLGK